MKLRVTIVYLLILSFECFSQNMKILKPTIGKKVSFTREEQMEWSRAIDLLYKTNNGSSNYETMVDKDKKLIDRLEMMEGPLTQGPGCSWYCGGGPYQIKASSKLDSTKTATYKADNAHDFNLFTAWVEGKPGYGIGEYLEFYFKPNSPRVNKLIIYNGYFKDQSLWESNSRVKQFKLYINNKPYAILDLADISASQSFSIEPVQSKVENKDLVLKLEILDVYKGSKYSDVAISEINFDGLDVHCLGKGTKIKQPNNKIKNIEDLVIGDTVLTYEYVKLRCSIGIIEKLEKVNHTSLVRYIFENGQNIISTQDHPFMVDKKKWCSLLPDKTKQYKGFSQITKVEIGDFFEMIGPDGKLSTIKLTKIQYLDKEQETFTISKLSTGNNFIANEMIVGIEEVKE